MSILKILQYPDLRLRRQGYRVDNVHARIIRDTIRQMIETLLATEQCAGLAATQLDLEHPPAITVINTSDKPTARNILCLINPQIVERHGNIIEEEEGCMSVTTPNKLLSAKVKRASQITVHAIDPQGSPLKFNADGFMARCIQHECDHLQGIIYLDHLEDQLKRQFEQMISP